MAVLQDDDFALGCPAKPAARRPGSAKEPPGARAAPAARTVKLEEPHLTTADGGADGAAAAATGSRKTQIGGKPGEALVCAAAAMHTVQGSRVCVVVCDKPVALWHMHEPFVSCSGRARAQEL